MPGHGDSQHVVLGKDESLANSEAWEMASLAGRLTLEDLETSGFARGIESVEAMPRVAGCKRA